MSKNVVVVGIGKRSRKVLLPALWEEDSYTIKAVLGTKERDERIGDHMVTVQTELTHEDWGDVDVLILAVPKEVVGKVLQKVPLHFRKNITLLIDTPVISPKKLGLLRTFAQFKNTFVSEDSLGLPFWEEATNLIQSGAIGTPKNIIFAHSGYRYHALAAAKRITGANAVWAMRCNLTSRGGVRCILMKGATVTIIEPRNYAIGRTLIVGTKGRISDYSLEFAEGTYEASLNTHSHYIPDAHTDEEIEAAKIIGFKRILKGAFEKNSPYRYAPIDGVYDYIACAISEKLGLFLDLPVGKNSLVKIFIMLLSVVSPR